MLEKSKNYGDSEGVSHSIFYFFSRNMNMRKYLPSFEEFDTREQKKLLEAIGKAKQRLDEIANSNFIKDFKIGKTADDFKAPDPLKELEAINENKTTLSDPSRNRFNGYKDFEAGRVIYKPEDEWLMDEIEKALTRYADEHHSKKYKNERIGGGRRKKDATKFKVYVVYNLKKLQK